MEDSNAKTFQSPLGSALLRMRGTTLMGAKHKEGILMSADSLVFTTQGEVRVERQCLDKIRPIENYMLFGGAGASVTTDMTFLGLNELARKKHMKAKVLTAKDGIKFALKVVKWCNGYFKSRGMDSSAWAEVMLASYEEKADEQVETNKKKKLSEQKAKSKKREREVLEDDEDEPEFEEKADEQVETNKKKKLSVQKAKSKKREREVLEDDEDEPKFKQLFNSTIHSFERYVDLQQHFSLKGPVENFVKENVEFDPAEYFQSGEFKGNSKAGLYFATEDEWYSVHRYKFVGKGEVRGMEFLVDHFKKQNIFEEAISIIEDAMVEACTVGGTGGTIQVLSINEHNKITTHPARTLEELRNLKDNRTTKKLKESVFSSFIAGMENAFEL